MHRLPEPIQDEHGMFQDGIHKPFPNNRRERIKVRHFGNRKARQLLACSPGATNPLYSPSPDLML
jgi:hypothetical protein